MSSEWKNKSELLYAISPLGKLAMRQMAGESDEQDDVVIHACYGPRRNLSRIGFFTKMLHEYAPQAKFVRIIVCPDRTSTQGAAAELREVIADAVRLTGADVVTECGDLRLSMMRMLNAKTLITSFSAFGFFCAAYGSGNGIVAAPADWTSGLEGLRFEDGDFAGVREGESLKDFLS